MNNRHSTLFVGWLTLLVTMSISPLLAQEMKNSKLTKILPIEYFTKPSEKRTAIISPDGKHIAAIVKIKGKEVFSVINVEVNKVISVIGVRGDGGNIGEVNWVNNERLVYSIYKVSNVDQRRRGTGELYAVNVDGSRHTIIFGHNAGQKTVGTLVRKRKLSHASHEILDYLEEDEKNILIAYYPWKVFGHYWRVNPDAFTQIKKLNIYTGKLTKVETLPISLADAIVDNQGNVRFVVGVTKNNEQVLFYKKNSNLKWEEFSIEQFNGSNIYPLSFTENNQSIYLSANVDGGTRAIYLFDLETKSISKLFHDKSIDMNQPIYDFKDRQVVYVATEQGLPEYYYIAKKNPKSILHRQLMKAFKGQDVVITSATKDGSKLIALVSADNNPGDFYLFETKTMNADYLMSRNSWIDPDLLTSMESVSFTTRDQQTIYGYLTLPRNVNGKLLPLVVYPHGGPHGVRDEWGYQWSVQLLASRGYAVLQVNFRGSDGYGRDFQEAGYGKWGTLMQDDITDATLALIERKVVDRNRICIYGASYGGYAALMGAVREPDLYQCAIGSVGVYDLPLMFEEGDIPNYSKSGLAYLKDAVGDNINDLKVRSPVYNVDKIKANILLIHGSKDERAPIEQANRLKEAFDKIDKTYGWLELANEGHGYIDHENRKKVYQVILDFLDENIGVKSTTSKPIE